MTACFTKQVYFLCPGLSLVFCFKTGNLRSADDMLQTWKTMIPGMLIQIKGNRAVSYGVPRHRKGHLWFPDDFL